MAQHTTEQFLQGFQLSLGIKIILPDGISIETRTYGDMERDKTQFFAKYYKIKHLECLTVLGVSSDFIKTL